jgi:hypothetical protein
MTTHMPMLPTPALSSKVGVLPYDTTTDVDAILTASVDLIRARGIAAGGLLQRSGERLSNGRSVMWVDDIVTGQTIRLDLPRGAGARACLLDPDALARVACLLQNTIESGAELIVVNRFGHAESEGHGLRAEIAAAIFSGAAVLIAVRDSRLNDLRGFLCGPVSLLPPVPGAIADWAELAAAIRQPADPDHW